MQGFREKNTASPPGRGMIFSTEPEGFGLAWEEHELRCSWLWNSAPDMLVSPDVLFAVRLRPVYGLSERNVIFAGEIKSYLKA